MSNELCWKCKDYFLETARVPEPFHHCHHEPKEKPQGPWVSTYHRGQKFKRIHKYYGGIIVMLSQINDDCQFSLLIIDNPCGVVRDIGNRWVNPIEIEGPPDALPISDNSPLWGEVGRKGWELIRD